MVLSPTMTTLRSSLPLLCWCCSNMLRHPQQWEVTSIYKFWNLSKEKISIPRLRRFAPYARIIIDTFLCITQVTTFHFSLIRLLIVKALHLTKKCLTAWLLLCLLCICGSKLATGNDNKIVILRTRSFFPSDLWPLLWSCQLSCIYGHHIGAHAPVGFHQKPKVSVCNFVGK